MIGEPGSDAGAAGGRALSGCATLDRAYKQEVTWTNVPTVQVFTNTIVVTNTVPQVVERTNVVFVTNAASGAVSAYAAREPVATNFVTDDADQRGAGVMRPTSCRCR